MSSLVSSNSKPALSRQEVKISQITPILFTINAAKRKAKSMMRDEYAYMCIDDAYLILISTKKITLSSEKKSKKTLYFIHVLCVEMEKLFSLLYFVQFHLPFLECQLK